MNRKILKKRCCICSEFHRENLSVCEKCYEEILKYSYGNKCIKCGRNLDSDGLGICSLCKKLKPQFDLAFAVFPYKDIFKEAVKEAKFGGEYHKISGMADFMFNMLGKMNLTFDCVIYVPTDIKTELRRRYCFSQELAVRLASKTKVPLYKNYLIKKSSCKKQSLVKFEERYINIKGAFIKNPLSLRNIKGKRILLVDDVLTTGSTMSEIAGILKKNGAKSVYCVALCYGASGE